MTSHVFQRPNGGRVAIPDDVIEFLERHRQMKPRDREAGGILLGRCILDSNDVIIDEAGKPARADKRSRFHFFRNAKPAQRAVDAAWEASKGTTNYLGEWHSHPEDDPHPSGVDLQNWQEIVARAVYEQDFLLFLIVGRVTTRIWELARPKMLLRRLPVDEAAAK